MGIFDKVKSRLKEKEFVQTFCKRLIFDENLKRFIMTNPGMVLNEFGLSDKGFNAIVLFTHTLNLSIKKGAGEKDASDHDIAIISDHLKGVESLGLDRIKKEALTYLEDFEMTEMYDTSKIIPRLAFSKFYDFISGWYISCGGYSDTECTKCGKHIYATSSNNVFLIPSGESDELRKYYPEFALRCPECGNQICLSCMTEWHTFSDKKYVNEPVITPLCPQCSSMLKG